MAIRTRLVVALVVVLGVIGALIRTAITHAATYYDTVQEVHDMGTAAVGRALTVSGTIVGRSVHWTPASSRLSFTIRDINASTTMPVVYHGAKPDDFSNDWPVIVSGTLQPDGTFEAKQLLIKCPSKYKAAQSGS
ncbi:MAG: cytochrome c maturation protein CcmE [Alicyclobacillus sp.]|nr:cytochrome c maturation protein CcmE [Alicyclobacillus sp.]